jgi:multidrug efflux pump subunit AcrA (membrane-fusion protein)
VYVLEDASERKIARKRFVQVGITRAQRCEVTAGLKPGETLVVNGMNYLADGMTVEVVRIEDVK